MKKKYEIINFNLNEYELLEKHLNEMAEAHWHLKWISTFVICYEYNENKIHYYIDFNKFPMSKKRYVSYDNNEENELNQFYEELGYDFVCSFDQFSIYQSKEKIEQIHTDENIKKKQSFKTKLRSFFYLCILPIIIIALTSLFLFIDLDLVLILTFTNYYVSIIVFILIALYMGFYSLSNYKCKSIPIIKLRSIVHIILVLLLFIIPIYSFYEYNNYSGISMNPLPYVLYTSFLSSYLFSFSSSNKKYKNVIFIFYFIPYLLAAIMLLLIITLPKDESKNLWIDKNPNYPQSFVDVSSFNCTNVNHYLEKESSLLTIIECRMKKEDDSFYNYYYYNDKKVLFSSIIMSDITSLNNYFLIDTFEDYEFYSENPEYLRNQNRNERSDMLIIKDNEYFEFHTSEVFTQEELREFVNNIQWQD